MQPVMLISGQPLKVWESIEIIVGSGADTGKYHSRVEDFINGGIVITAPEFVEGHTLLRHNVDVIVNVVRDDAIYQFSSQIKQRASASGRFLILTPPRNIRRVQRRRFVRIELMTQVRYAWINPTMEWEDYEERLRWENSKTIDISGGGMLIKLHESGEKDRTGELVLLDVGFLKEVGLPEVVVAVSRRIFQLDENLFAGVEMLTQDNLRDFFTPEQEKRLPDGVTGFDGMAQDRLVSHIFNKQIELRNKGLL